MSRTQKSIKKDQSSYVKNLQIAIQLVERQAECSVERIEPKAKEIKDKKA
jgi:hypothetical protein